MAGKGRLAGAERGHLSGLQDCDSFGENDLGRHLAQAPYSRTRLQEIKKELDALVLATFEDSQRALGVPASERAEIGHLYLDTVARLGFES